MRRTAVIFAEKATPRTLTEFKDALSNTLLSLLEPWNVEFRTYRYQVKSLPADQSKLMCSISFSHHGKKTVLIKDGLCLVTTSGMNDIPEALLSNGCCSSAPESIDTVLSSKLSNIWSQRQSIKGEAGETFETTGLIVKAINLFSSTGFKGLLIELTSDEGASEEQFGENFESIRDILKEIGMKDLKTSSELIDVSKNDYICDLAYQYVRVLNF